MKKLFYGDDLSKLYDLFTERGGYYDYKKALKNIKPILSDKKNILEIGIGTATFSILLAKQGFNITGIDISKSMIKIGKEKALKNKVNIKFSEQDMIDFSFDKKFDVAISFGGGLQITNKQGDFKFWSYLLDKDQFLKTFKRINSHLNKNGLFLIHSLNEKNISEIDCGDGVFYFPKIKQITKNKISRIHEFKINKKTICKETHTIRVMSLKMINKIFKESGFEIIGFDKSTTFYILKKK